jgi:tetratricopeptide (TPR) repeat protein
MKNNLLLLIIVSMLSFNSIAQKEKNPIDEKKRDNFANIDALKTYERVAEKGYKSIDIFKKLGNSYYYNSELDNAVKWYGQLFALTQDVEPEYFYRYAQSLRAIGQNDKADLMLKKFNLLTEVNDR